VQLLQLGLASPVELGLESDGEEDETSDDPWETQVRLLTVSEKLLRLFHADFPDIDARIVPVWAAGELLEFGGDFDKFIVAHKLQKQEGIIFRHVLRLILLIREFQQPPPPDIDPEEWNTDLERLLHQLAESCRHVDEASTEKTLTESETKPNLT